MLQVLSTGSQKQAQPNPLHGSAGMIQVLPVHENSERLHRKAWMNRLDLNDPHTSVCGFVGLLVDRM